MCGVIGFYSPDPQAYHMEALIRLYKQSAIRGLHSFGFSTWEPGRGFNDEIRTFKSHRLEELCLELHRYRISPPELLIGHNRYSTSGDWQHHSNNQPVHIRGISMVFNGVITQAPKEVYEKQTGKNYQTENDGEIFSRKVLDGEDWQNFVSRGTFSFAGLFLKGGEVYAIRNKQRPLWYSSEPDAVYVASTRDIFTRAGGFARPFEFEPGKAVKLDKEFLCVTH